MIDIHIAKTDAEIKEVLKIRKDVFVKGQGITKNREQDGLDDLSEHVIFYYNHEPIGTTRIRYKNNNMKLERIAILDKFRAEGFGGKLMEFLVQYGKDKNVNEIYMHAQYYLIDFYSKFKFKQRGDAFYDKDINNIKHVELYLKLN